MTGFTKGGRGKKAPYETTHYRLPEPRKDTVEIVCNTWKHLITFEDNNHEDEHRAKNLLTAIEDLTTAHYAQEFDKPVNEYFNKLVTSFEDNDKLGNNLLKLLKDAIAIDGRRVAEVRKKIQEAVDLLGQNLQ